ncbi:MAG: anthranilate synthase component I family protein, partial [Deltaproteobacteria bacterium]|nr:anthranilate synthase component I family protein [Deltaproteobacteria bacterium]
PLPPAAPAGAPASPSFASPARPRPLAGEAGYTAAVARIKEQIRQGEAIQVVLSTPFSAPLAESPFNLYRRLRRLNPSPYMFYIRLPDPVSGVLLGSSPEVLVSCEANKLRLCPIAGTRPRSRDRAEDALFGDELLQDPKEKAEHVMLVDLGRNDLGRIAAPGSVKLDRFMELERFSHVMHLTSRISADLAPGLDALDVLASAFPAGTVSGAPKVRAMELVAQEEQSPRGPYAGAIGWLGLDKDAVHLDFGITIRSLWVREGQVRWQAGAGIVYDSVPENEWRECRAKAEVIRKVALGDESPV